MKLSLDYGFNNMGHIAEPDIKNGLCLNDCTEVQSDGDPEDVNATACPNGDWPDSLGNPESGPTRGRSKGDGYRRPSRNASRAASTMARWVRVGG